MRVSYRNKTLLAAAVVVLTSWQLAISQEKSLQPANTIACRVMEVHVNTELHVATVVFHQKNKNDGPRLGSLLAKYAGLSVEFQAGGAWHKAQVFRLKSCFGRGLLVFSSREAQLGEKAEFSLKFPAE